jgi:hypothetical protein
MVARCRKDRKEVVAVEEKEKGRMKQRLMCRLPVAASATVAFDVTAALLVPAAMSQDVTLPRRSFR